MKRIILIIISLCLLSSVGLVYAQVDNGVVNKPVDNGVVNKPVVAKPVPEPSKKLQNPLKVDSVKGVILLAVDIAIYVGVSFAILAIIFVGFKFVMASGNSDAIKEAKTWFFYIIIGLAILISAKVIVDIIQNTLVDSGVVKEKIFSP